MEAETVDHISFVHSAFNDEPLTQFWGGGSLFKVEACVSTRPRVHDTYCMIPRPKESDCRFYYLQKSLMTVLTDAANYGALDAELEVILGGPHRLGILWGQGNWGR